MTRREHLISSLAITFFAVLVILAMLFRTQTADFITSLGYTPTPAMATLRDHIQLTPQSNLIFNASHPQLDSREHFVVNCPSTRPDANLLGCYATDRTIHVYTIELSELNGIEESTLAHELLHAIYARHTAATLSWLEPLLRTAYEENQAKLQASLAFYSSEELLDELHSRLATEVMYLPAELERYYSDYFWDQDALVRYFDTYDAHLNRLRAESAAQLDSINTLSQAIETRRTAYQTDSVALSTEINAFNARADRGDFSGFAAYDAEHAHLSAEISRLEQLYAEIERDITKYNQLVDHYNANALHLQTLDNAMDATAPPELSD
jgi:hypothetical protein